MNSEISIYVLWPLRIAQILAIFSIFISLLLVYDFFTPSNLHDDVIVIKKYKSQSSKVRFYVEVKGNINRKSKIYEESVNSKFYREVKTGDLINVEFSTIFNEWRTIKLIRGKEEILASKGKNIGSGLFLSFIFLFTLASFVKTFFTTMKNAMFFLFFIYGIELVSLVIGTKLYFSSF